MVKIVIEINSDSEKSKLDAMTLTTSSEQPIRDEKRGAALGINSHACATFNQLSCGYSRLNTKTNHGPNWLSSKRPINGSDYQKETYGLVAMILLTMVNGQWFIVSYDSANK